MAVDFRSHSPLYGDMMSMQFWQTVLRFRKKAKLPMILQEEMAECAHACIAMIVNFWGCKLSLSTLR